MIFHQQQLYNKKKVAHLKMAKWSEIQPDMTYTGGKEMISGHVKKIIINVFPHCYDIV